MFKRIHIARLQEAIAIALLAGMWTCAFAQATPQARPETKPENEPSSTPLPASLGGKAAMLQSYGKLPMSFEANQGQADAHAKFVARGKGYSLYLTGQEAVLALRKSIRIGSPGGIPQRLNAQGIPLSRPSSVRPSAFPNLIQNPLVAAPHPSSNPMEDGDRAETGSTTRQEQSDTDIVRMQIAGANPNVAPVGQDKLPGTVSYFLGNDPAKWHSAVPTYSRVQYKGIYPGIDLVYYGNQQQLEYDFVVAPGASAQPIRLHFTGSKLLRLDDQGDLTIASKDGSIAFRKPDVYQTVHGVKTTVAGSFKLLADNTVSFTLGRYDHTKPLVIDPILAYSTFFGGSNADFVVAVASDASGDAYLTGLTASSDFPLTAGAFQDVDYATPSNGVSTAFVSKLNASGTALLYSTFIGGVGVQGTLHQQGDYGKAIAIDASGDAYITGYTYSANFPVTGGAFQVTNKAAAVGFATGFVTKLNPSGTGLVYSTYLGGSQLDQLTAITLDANGNAYIAGVSASNDFPTTAGVVQPSNLSYGGNGFNYVITKMNSSGSALIYSTYLGGSDDNAIGDGSIYWTNPIAVDKSGNAYVAGFTTASNFPVTANAFQKKSNGSYTVTVSKLNPTATALVYSTYLGGASGSNYGSISEGLAVDSAGNAYVAGYTSETDFPVTSGAFQTTNKADTNTTTSPDANQNGFITKINPTGSGLVYSTYLGGTTGPWGGDQIYELAIDSAGDAYVTGSAMSADFPVTSNAYQSTNKGATHCCDYTTYTSDAFLTELNPSGTALVYSTYLGGAGTQNTQGAGGFGDTAYGLGLGKNGNVYIVGFTTSPTFPVTAGAFNTTYKTAQNPGFVANFNLGTAPTTKDTETTLSASANSVVPGTSVTFTAKVAAVSGSTIPTGNVVFVVDEATVATVALSGTGTATYTTSTLVAGEHYILASYAGSSSFSSSGDGLNEFITPVTPVISPKGGTYTSQQSVTITESTAGAVLYYTQDGSAATRFSTPYTAPIAVNLSQTIHAVGVSQDSSPSASVSATYTIIGSPSVLAGPVTSITATTAKLNAYVNSLGLTGSYYFLFGTSAASLTGTSAKTAMPAATTRVSASAALSGLVTKTTYYYQVVVVTAGGTTTGSLLSFTTN